MNETDRCNVESVINFWFGGDQQINYKTKWFPEGCSTVQSIADQTIYDKYHELFNEALAGQLNHWQEATRPCVALIIILDQFSRHICRLKVKIVSASIQKKADEMAVNIAHKFHAVNVESKNLSIAEYVFSLMPLRHTATVDHLNYVLECLKGKEEQEAKSVELLNRFRKQTIRRLQHLEDRAKVSCK